MTLNDASEDAIALLSAVPVESACILNVATVPLLDVLVTVNVELALISASSSSQT